MAWNVDKLAKVDAPSHAELRRSGGENTLTLVFDGAS
jgi:hypothetical protein